MSIFYLCQGCHVLGLFVTLGFFLKIYSQSVCLLLCKFFSKYVKLETHLELRT